MKPLKHYLALAFFRLTPPCNDITLLASRAMDTTLTIKEGLQLRLHLFLCSACHRFNIHIHLLRDLMHNHAHSEAIHQHDHTLPSPSMLLHHEMDHYRLSDEAQQRMKQVISSNLQSR
ncbi:MAG: hypothetical protein ACOVSW_01690 [Candidatus Kapaibacteriota bacterium]|jgi:hypothetical protein